MRFNCFPSVLLILLINVTALAQSSTGVAGANPIDGNKLPILTDGVYALKPGEVHRYRIDLIQGQFFHALIEQQGIDLRVELFDPEGSKIATTDTPNGRWGPEPVLLVAQMTGNYRVDVFMPNAKAEGGPYKVEIKARREPTAADKAHVEGERLFENADVQRLQGPVSARREVLGKYEQALNLFRISDDKYFEALTLSNIGIVRAQLNEFREALKAFEASAPIFKSLGDQRLEGSTENFIGGMNDVLGNISESRAHYEKAIQLARQLNNIPSEGSALNNIGKLHSDAGNFQMALDYYLQALPLFRDIPARRAITLNNIGVAYTNLNEPEKAFDYLQQSLALMKAGTDRNAESYTLSNLGTTQRGLMKYQAALDFYNQAREIQLKTGNRAQEAETLDLMGTIYSAMGQPETALGFHQQALEIQRTAKNVRREALCLSNLGHVYLLLGQTTKALEYFDQALTILRAIGDQNNLAVTLEDRARAELKQGNLAAARKDIEESLSLIETVRAHSGSQQLRSSYLASREKAYEFYIDLLMQLDAKEPGKGHDAEALQVSERGRARSLLEMINEARVAIRSGVGGALAKREREIAQSLNAKAQRQIQLTAQKGSRQEIDTLNKEISALEDEYQQVQVEIRKASPAYAALIQPQPLTLQEIQSQLDQDTLLLEYSLGDDRSYLWVVGKDSLKTFALPKRESIQKAAQDVYESLTARSLVKASETAEQRRERVVRADAQFQTAAAALSRIVLEPAAKELSGKRIVVVADGALQYVPFAALSITDASVVADTPRSYRPLILEHEVVSLPSASALAVQRNTLLGRKPAANGVAVIADPVFSTSDARFKSLAGKTQPTDTALSRENETRIIEHTTGGSTGQFAINRLPFTRQEAEQILAVAPRGANFNALDFRANRAVATSGELSKYRYVHFATHGYLDSNRPALSALVLSLVDEKGQPQDGFLRSLDIYNLNLRAELVVLSACETGLGKEVKGEGLVGLTQGFMSAGARRVVVSLWNVNDKATASLMQSFYRNMLRNNKTPSSSLRQAQIEMFRSRLWQSPYYWAPFVLQGEWR